MLRSPLAKAAMTSGAMMAAGDVICQTIQLRKSLRNRTQRALKNVTPREHPIDDTITRIDQWRQDVDWTRTLRLAIVGLTLHGPWFFYGFRWIDRVCGSSKSLSTALYKTAVGQITIFPIYVAAFFTYTQLLEGKTLDAGLRHMRSTFWPTFQTGCVFWPVANIFNFALVPTAQRVLYVNAVGLVWNTYMSWQDSKL